MTPAPRVLQTPPYIAIEVLSPEDRMACVTERLQDFLDMGVEHVWLLDPVERAAFTYTAQGLERVTSRQILIPGSSVYVDLLAIFAELK